MDEIERKRDSLAPWGNVIVACDRHGLTAADGRAAPWADVRPGRYRINRTLDERWTVALARVSNDEQVRSGSSLPHQIKLALQAATQTGSAISHVYLDPGQSATNIPLAKRPGVSSLMVDIKRGTVGTIILYKRDRIARQLLEWFEILKICAKHKIRILFTCDGEPPLGQGVYGKFLESILIGAAELETGVTGMRLSDCRLGLIRNGLHSGGRLPYGYKRLADRSIQLVPEEAEIIRRIFHLAATEKLGYMRVAKRLNVEYPRSRRGREWTIPNVSLLVKNRLYCGFVHLVTGGTSQARQYHEVRSDSLPAIVSEYIWNQAQEAREARRPARTTQTQSGACSGLLAGLATCQICGRRVSAVSYDVRRRHQTRVSYRRTDYRCHRAHSLAGCTNRHYVSAQITDVVLVRAVTAKLRELDANQLLAETQDQRASQKLTLAKDFSGVQEVLAAVNDKISRCQDELESASKPSEEQRLAAELRDLLERKSELLLEGEDMRMRLEQDWSGLTDQERALRSLQEWPADLSVLPKDKQREWLMRILKRIALDGRHRQMNLVFRFPVESSGAGELRYQYSVPIPYRI